MRKSRGEKRWMVRESKDVFAKEGTGKAPGEPGQCWFPRGPHGMWGNTQASLEKGVREAGRSPHRGAEMHSEERVRSRWWSPYMGPQRTYWGRIGGNSRSSGGMRSVERAVRTMRG